MTSFLLQLCAQSYRFNNHHHLQLILICCRPTHPVVDRFLLPCLQTQRNWNCLILCQHSHNAEKHRKTMLCSTHIPNLKCLRLSSTKKWKAKPNVKYTCFEPPFGGLGVTHRVHSWLDGKHIVDVLLAIMELFSLALTAVAQLSEICRNRRFLKG